MCFFVWCVRLQRKRIKAIDNEFAIELDKDELKLFKGLFAEMFK